MAPFEEAASLNARQQFGCSYGYYYSDSARACVRDGGSRWYDWGRWVLAGIVVVVFILTLLLLARNTRRRRRNGVMPLRGTGWMAPGPAPPYHHQPPPPQYTASPPVYPQGTGQKFNQNDGYYGQQQQGIQLQSPPNSYQPPQPYGGETYAPPQGPPPNR